MMLRSVRAGREYNWDGSAPGMWPITRPVWWGRVLLAFFIGCCAPAYGGASKILKFWNLTAATITELYLAPAGTSHWSANLCSTDPDHTVEPDERIGMIGITGGQYSVRVVDQEKRRCTFDNMTVTGGGAYALSISENDMKDCAARFSAGASRAAR